MEYRYELLDCRFVIKRKVEAPIDRDVVGGERTAELPLAPTRVARNRPSVLISTREKAISLNLKRSVNGFCRKGMFMFESNHTMIMCFLTGESLPLSIKYSFKVEG